MKLANRKNACEILAASACFGLSLAAHAQTDIPPGPGRDVTVRMCSMCHSLSVVTGQRMTKDHWTAQVDDMVSRGAKGTPDEVATVINYLSTNFGTSGSPVAADIVASKTDIRPPVKPPRPAPCLFLTPMRPI